MELHDQAVLPWGNAHRAQAREATHRQIGCHDRSPLGRDALAVTRSVENSTKCQPPTPHDSYPSSRAGARREQHEVLRSTACRTSIRPGLSAELALHAMAVEFPQVHGHPNRLPFEGVLTLIDVPSDKAPSGARGHRVLLTRAAAEAALPSLLGMAVDYKSGWDGHDARQKCGIITSAEIDGHRLTVAGFLFARDFPEIEQRLTADAARSACHPERSEGSPHLFSDRGQMGMSYELADAHVADMSAPIWTLTRATFTGAAILLRDKAAYRDTTFSLRTTKPGAPCSTRVSRVDHGVTASA